MSHDAFDSLYLPIVPVQPREDLTQSLRRRVTAALQDDVTETVGAHDLGEQKSDDRRVSFALHYRDVGAAVRWLNEVMGLSQVSAHPKTGAVRYASLRWGTDQVSVNAKHGLYASMGPTFVTLHVDSADELQRIYARARAQGADIAQPLAEDWDGRSKHFIARDPEGHLWEVLSPVAATDPR